MQDETTGAQTRWMSKVGPDGGYGVPAQRDETQHEGSWPKKLPLRREAYSFVDWCVGTGVGQMVAIFLTGAIILIVGMFLYKNAAWMQPDLLDTPRTSYRLALWTSWTMFTDPGTQTGAGNDAREQAVAVFVSLLGYIFFLSVMGIVVDLVRQTLDDWKTFHSRVVANEHTLILGWSTKTLYLLQQLAQGQMDIQQGDRSVPDRDVVVMADVDEDRCIELQREVTGFFSGKNDGLDVRVCQGSPTSTPDLLRASVRTAEQIVVMSPDPAWLAEEDGLTDTTGHDERADQYVLSVVLALTSIATNLTLSGEASASGHKEAGMVGAVIAEVKRPETLGWIYHVTTDLAGDDAMGPDTARALGLRSVVLLQADALLADMLMKQLLIRHAFEPVIGSVLEELLGYEGQDLYFGDFDGALVGRTFGEARRAVEQGVVLGLMESENSVASAAPGSAAQGRRASVGPGSATRGSYDVIMNPRDERVLTRGEKLLYIAEAALSNDDVAPQGHERASAPPALPSVAPPPAKPAVVDLDAVGVAAPTKLPAKLFNKEGPSTVLLFGWQAGSSMQELLGLIDQEVAPGSSVHIISEKTVEERKVSACCYCRCCCRRQCCCCCCCCYCCCRHACLHHLLIHS